MTNSKQLHYEAGRIYQKSQAKMNEANKITAKAETFEKAGDSTRAANETRVANRLYEEALRLEKIAIKYDNEAADLEAQALELENQASRLQQSFNYEIEKLVLRQKALRGDI